MLASGRALAHRLARGGLGSQGGCCLVAGGGDGDGAGGGLGLDAGVGPSQPQVDFLQPPSVNLAAPGKRRAWAKGKMKRKEPWKPKKDVAK